MKTLLKAQLNKLKILLITILFTLSSSLVFAQSNKKNQNKTKEVSSNFYEDLAEEDFENFESDRKIQVYDPYENINRRIYIFNDAFDRHFFEHVARFYRKGVPKVARKMIGNFINNLSLPMSAINSFLQGKVDNGLATTSNFLINSTVGILGFFEIAEEKGIFYNKEDFGQTFGYYDVGSGAYLMIPFLGPSSTRDFSGWALDRAISPSGFNVFEIGDKENIVDPGYLIGITFLSAVDTRESLLETIDDIRKDSFDPYATIRSAYLQQRINEIKK